MRSSTISTHAAASKSTAKLTDLDVWCTHHFPLPACRVLLLQMAYRVLLLQVAAMLVATKQAAAVLAMHLAATQGMSI